MQDSYGADEMSELPWIALAVFLAGLTFIAITDAIENDRMGAVSTFSLLLVFSILIAVSVQS